jgi:hypothetical protein
MKWVEIVIVKKKKILMSFGCFQFIIDLIFFIIYGEIF